MLDHKMNYVIPDRMRQYSTGFSENWQYIQTGREIVRRYGKQFSSINTTITTWNTKSNIKLLIVPTDKLLNHKIWRKFNLAK